MTSLSFAIAQLLKWIFALSVDRIPMIFSYAQSTLVLVDLYCRISMQNGKNVVRLAYQFGEYCLKGNIVRSLG